jgi:hypothetical protein
MEYERMIIDTSKPFCGNSVSITYKDAEGVERVMYSGYLYNDKEEDLTLEQYQEKRKGEGEFKAVSIEEYDAMEAAFNESLKSSPAEITEEQYNYFLEVLPPCRWQNIDRASIFHISERLRGNLVQWCFSLCGKFYAFTDDATISADKLRAKIEEVVHA